MVEYDTLAAVLVTGGTYGLVAGLGGHAWVRRQYASNVKEAVVGTVYWDHGLTAAEVAWLAPVVATTQAFAGMNVFVTQSSERKSDLVMRPVDGTFGERPDALSAFLDAPERAVVLFFTNDYSATMRMRDTTYVDTLLYLQPELQRAGTIAAMSRITLALRILHHGDG